MEIGTRRGPLCLTRLPAATIPLPLPSADSLEELGAAMLLARNGLCLFLPVWFLARGRPPVAANTAGASGDHARPTTRYRVTGLSTPCSSTERACSNDTSPAFTRSTVSWLVRISPALA